MTAPKKDSQISTPVDKNRRIFLRIVLIVGVFGSVILPLINNLLHLSNQSFLIDLFAFFLFLFILGLSGIKKAEKINYWVITLFSFIAVLVINFQSPELFNVQNVSLFILFPIVAVFFLGKRAGTILSLFFLICVSLFILSVETYTTAFQIAFDIGIAVFILYFYEMAQETTQEELSASIQQLTEQKEQLERMNHVMVDRELKMIQMKKEIEELKKKHESTS